MNLLLIHQYFLEKNDGGGSRFNEMARIWEQAGHSITVVSGMVHYTQGKKYDRFKGKFIVKEKNSNGITLYRCHVSDAYNKSFSGRLWAYFSFVFSSIVCISGIRKRFDVVLVTSPPLFVIISGVFASWICKAKLVFEVRDLWPESAIDTGVLTNQFLIRTALHLERFAYRAARLINVLTPAFRTVLVEKKNVDPQKIILIPNAADFSISDEIVLSTDRTIVRSELGLSGEFVVIYVGAHGVANDLQQLIDVAGKMAAENVLFLLIGDGMEKPRLIAEAACRQVSNIRFLDAVPKRKIFEYIIAADAGISVLKRVETFKTVYSNKTFDYMACRKPVVMAIDGVSRELVETAECGLFAEPGRPDDIVCVVRRYQSDPALALRHGANGYLYAKTHFDRQELAQRYMASLENLK